MRNFTCSCCKSLEYKILILIITSHQCVYMYAVFGERVKVMLWVREWCIKVHVQCTHMWGVHWEEMKSKVQHSVNQ